MILWGLSWTCAKILGMYADPPVLMFWRFIIAVISFIPILIWARERPRLNKRSFGYVIASACFLTLYNYFYFQGTQVGLAGRGAVIVTTMNPIFTFVLTVIFFQQVVYRKDILGLIAGFAGGSLILKIWEIDLASLLATGNLLFLLCAVSWAFLTISTSKAKIHIPTLSFSFLTFLFSCFIVIPIGLLYDVLQVFTYDWIFWLNMILVSTFSMSLATTIYFIGTTRLGSEKSSTFIFTVPVSAVGFSMIFLGESLHFTTAAGGVLAITAVYLINMKPPKKQA